ncbi:hypothetical protein [Bacteroides sp.]
MMMNRTISLFIVLACLLTASGRAQPLYKATLPVVDTTGFYRIDLPYDILGASRPDLTDIRIKDEKGREIAWSLRKDEERMSRKEFIPFRTEILSGKYQTDVMVETDGKPLSSFVMRIKNADSDKRASLLGSYNRKTWFAVSEHLRLNGINNPTGTESFIELKFPLSDYLYYKISIKDSLTSPLNIVGVGSLQIESSLKQRLVNIPLKRSEIHTNGKYTDIHLVFPFKSRVSELVFYISAPQYYRRNITLYPSSVTGKLVADGGNPIVIACNQYTDTLTLSVNNGDDRPLSIDSIKAYTPKYYLIAGLEQGVHYSMTYGDETASSPEYDLSFSIHVSDSIASLMPGNIEKQSAPRQEDSFSWGFYLKKYGIWAVIILIIIQIVYIVRRLLK